MIPETSILHFGPTTQTLKLAKRRWRRAEDGAQPRKVDMKTLVSRLRVACHQRSGKYSTWWRDVDERC